MERKASFTAVFVSILGIALAVLIAALPAAGAPGSEAVPKRAAADSGPGVAFIHTASEGNIRENHTYIDHPLTNRNPNAILIITQNWSPGGHDVGYLPYVLGVWYDNSARKWAIFNQDLAAMFPGVAFNVLIPAAGTDAFVHTAAAGSIAGHTTYIDHPSANNNPNAILLVTQNWNPGGTAGTYNDHAIGVWYSASAHRWAVFNQDFAAMPAGADFNVLIPAASPNLFVHTATAGNAVYSGLGTYLDHPMANNSPDSFVFATQNWNPGGVGGTYNPFPIGVSYHKYTNQKWAVMNQTVVAIPYGAAFNIMVVPFYKIYLPVILRGS